MEDTAGGYRNSAGRLHKVSRADPYRNFRFRVKWDGRHVAGFGTASGLTQSAPGLPGGTPKAITLERGVTLDPEFERWASASHGASGGARRDLAIETYDEAGRLAVTHNVRQGWVSEFAAIPDLDANANAVLIEHLRLENEGVERS